MSLPVTPVIRKPNATTPKVFYVGIGELQVTDDPTAELVTFSLGSCVGVSVYDPNRKVGGLLHIMLPDSTANLKRAAEQPQMFADTALPILFHSVYALGGQKENLIVKIAGGGDFLDAKKIFEIGKKNVEAVRTMLTRNKVKISSADTGGRRSRTMRLDLATGKVTIESPGQSKMEL